jgi:CheY-like chemotaxis protein
MRVYQVLIVDDQRDVRRMLRAALETLSQDLKITDVPSGEEAILVISRQPVDLLIADVRLPGITGLELLARARVRNPALRLILITGMSDEKVRARVEQSGADAFFYKPIEISAFLETVQQLLNLPLKEQTGEEAQISVSPTSEQKSLLQRITDLRLEIDAAFVALMDESGGVVAQVGDAPQASGEWGDATASALALMRLLPIVSPLVISGAAHDLLLFPVTKRFLLVVGVDRLALETTLLGKLSGAFRRTSQDLAAMGIELDQRTTPPIASNDVNRMEAPQDVEEEAAQPTEVDEALLGLQSNHLNHVDVDAFWENALQDFSPRSNPTHGLSYEQARQLGLAPDEE